MATVGQPPVVHGTLLQHQLPWLSSGPGGPGDFLRSTAGPGALEFPSHQIGAGEAGPCADPGGSPGGRNGGPLGSPWVPGPLEVVEVVRRCEEHPPREL